MKSDNCKKTFDDAEIKMETVEIIIKDKNGNTVEDDINE